MTVQTERYVKCKTEQEFKMEYIRQELRDGNHEVFCIETEETVKGFPDVLSIDKRNGVAVLYEFKRAKGNGYIEFEPSQPAFYRSHPKLYIYVVALNPKENVVHKFFADSIFDEKSGYKMNVTNNRVNLGGVR